MVFANLTMKETVRGRFTLQRLPFKNVNDQSRDGKYEEATSDYSLSPDEPNVLLPFLTASGTFSKQHEFIKRQDGKDATRSMRRFSVQSLNIPKIKARGKVTDLNWKVKEDKIAQTDENSDPSSIMNNNKFILEDLRRLKKVEKQLRQELENARGNVCNTNQSGAQVSALQAELKETRQIFKKVEEKLKKEEVRAEKYFSENVRLQQEFNQRVQELNGLQHSFENLSEKYENLKTSQFTHEQKCNEMEEKLEHQKLIGDKLKMKLKKLNEEAQQNMNVKLDRLSSAYENLSKEHDHLKSLHLSLESKFKEASEEIQLEKERFKGLSVKYQELRNHKQNENESNRKILDDLSQAHIEIIKVNQQIEATTKAEQQSRNEIRRLNETIRELNSAYHDLYSKSSLIENEKGNLKGQFEQQVREISTLQQSLSVKEKELKRMQVVISDMNHSLQVKCQEKMDWISPAEHRSNLRVLEYYRNLVQTDAESSKNNTVLLKGRMREIESLEQKIEFLVEENVKLRQRCQLYEAKYESIKEMYDQLNAASWMDSQAQANEPLYESILEVQEIDPSELEQGAVGGSTFIEYKMCPYEPSCTAVFTRTRHLKKHIREQHPGLIE